MPFGDGARQSEQVEIVMNHPIKRLADIEQAAILEALYAHGGNRTAAARALGISVRTIRNKIRLYRELGRLPAEVDVQGSDRASFG